MERLGDANSNSSLRRTGDASTCCMRYSNVRPMLLLLKDRTLFATLCRVLMSFGGKGVDRCWVLLTAGPCLRSSPMLAISRLNAGYGDLRRESLRRIRQGHQKGKATTSDDPAILRAKGPPFSSRKLRKQ